MMLYTNEIRQVRDCFFIKILEYNLIEGIDKVYILESRLTHMRIHIVVSRRSPTILLSLKKPAGRLAGWVGGS